MVTTMTNPSPNAKPPYELQGVVEATQPLMRLADEMGWPKQWLICQHCGEHGWRVPPHIFDPCPLVVETMEAAGLKMDAERNQAIQSGVAMRDQLDLFRQWLGREMQGEEEG